MEEGDYMDDIFKDPLMWFLIGTVCGIWFRDIVGRLEERKENKNE